MSEERLREAIRMRIQKHYGLDGKEEEQKRSDAGTGIAFRLHGNDQDAKLEREIPKKMKEEEPEPKVQEAPE